MPSENLNRSDELLLALLDGPFKRARDENHVDPHAILVWDPSRIPVIQSVDILDLLGRYPCGGPGSQWGASDLLEILIDKRNQYRKSIASHDISDDDPLFTPACGTVVLIVSDDPSRGHRWVSINALIEPGQ